MPKPEAYMVEVFVLKLLNIILLYLNDITDTTSQGFADECKRFKRTKLSTLQGRDCSVLNISM